ncbi:MAG: type 4a pilus biogenesis protein PilO [Ostreibacterium sp.]
MAKKSNININDLSTWTLPLVLFSFIVIVVLLVYLAKEFFVDDVSGQIESKNVQIVKEEKTYATNRKIIALLPFVRKEVAALKVIRDDAKTYLPTQISMPSLIDNVYLSARNNGIVFSQFTPEKDIDTDFYTIKPISLSADVGYVSMANFIEEVTTLKRIMNVESVSFERTEDVGTLVNGGANSSLKMKAQLRTYIFKDDTSISKSK